MSGRLRFFPLLFVLVWPAQLRAQGPAVSGVVNDQSGGRLPAAVVTLIGPNSRETKVTDGEGAFRFAPVLPGEYELLVAASGFAEVRRSGIKVGNDAVNVPPFTMAVAGTGETVVVSASRQQSTVLDAPATVTVLPAAEIEALPSQSYGDLLRTVPGTNVVQLSPRDINVTTREATSTLATSQLALLDGRSLYLDFFGLVLWDLVPTSADDIKQIEVVRGPASAVWGANALTGVVNIITKTPRESAGESSIVVGGGFFDRDFGSTGDRGIGGLFTTSVTTSHAANDRWSYRVSGGYYGSSAYARPVGRIPVIRDPRDPNGTATVGGAQYPADAEGALGTAYRNTGTSQPKLDVRVDHALTNGQVTYGAGVAGTTGTIYTGTGPFRIEPGSVMGYGRVAYTRGTFRLATFTNIVDAHAPHLLLADPSTGRPLQLDFNTATYDVEVSRATAVGVRQSLSYGGNYRRNQFDIALAPRAKDRNEFGVYGQDDVFLNRWRVSLGARVDKFGNLDDPAFSPRLSVSYRVASDHVIRAGFNRAFRSPSSINNYLELTLATPVDLRGLAPLLPPALQPAVATPFPLVSRAIGSELPIGTIPQAPLVQESLTAYELAYTATVRGRTTVGAAVYVNDLDDNINFVQLPTNLDPYTAANPPPGWVLPPAILTAMAQVGVFLPRTAFTYRNLGPLREKGVELSVDHHRAAGSAFANYSWQARPAILANADPFPFIELALPPAHRVNVGGTYAGSRLLGSVTVNYTSKAFWSDVLNTPYHGFTDAFTMVNGSFGVKWNVRLTTTVKSTNLFNRQIQQHVFGDILGRSVVVEARIKVGRARP